MQINAEQLERQLEGRAKWFNSNCDGILNYATGVGKSYTTNLCITELEKESQESYLILVPGAELEIQWNEKLVQYFPKNILNRVLVKTVHKIISEGMQYEVGTLIVDELHEFHTEDRIKLINNTKIKCKRFLGLTASADDKNFYKILRHRKIVDIITKAEAIDKGFIAQLIEYNLGLTLTKSEQETYDVLSATISNLMPKFENNLEYAQKVLNGGKDRNNQYYSGAGWATAMAFKKGWKRDLNLTYPAHQQINDLWNPSFFIGWANRLINAIRGRKNLLCNANAKYNATLEIMNKYNKVKTIIFSESTDFADKIGVILNNHKHPTVVYHSNLATKTITSPVSGKLIKYGKVRQKKEALSRIRLGQARVLAVTKALDRGLDIPDIRMSIVSSGSNSTTQNTQRGGRAGRKEQDEDEPVLLINLYIVDTQDEIWLNNRQRNNTHECIVIDKVEDISYIPPSNAEFTINDI